MFSSKKHLLALPFYIVIVVVCACQPAETRRGVAVNPPQGTQRRIYSFTANPTQPTTLRFDAAQPSAPFSVEVIDNSGRIVATFSGSGMQTASLTLAPANGLYQVALAAADAAAASSVRVSIVDTQTQNYGSQSAPAAQVCTITATHPGGVNMRAQPALNAPALGVLAANSSLPADARSAGGWYRVYSSSSSGWVAGDVVNASGMCADLPLQLTPTTTDSAANAATGTFVNALSVTNYAPYDAASFYFDVDADSGATFSESVSFPDGDSSDRVLLAVSGLAAGIDISRPFALTMACSGAGSAELRWGGADSPALRCGETAQINFTTQYDRQMLLVTLPTGSTQSYVTYTLRAAPIAPSDAPVLDMGIDLNSGGQFTDRVSFPAGDRADSVQIGVVNFAMQTADNYRDVLVWLECGGSGVENVRWGLPGGTAQGCGGALSLALSQLDNIKTLLVILPDNSSGESYVHYTLHALPVALPDTEAFTFGFDRDAGGVFNETLSAPFGDNSDAIMVNVNNLTATPPHNYRSIQLTLICGGVGIEQVRWGTPSDVSLLCHMNITVPFLYGEGGQPVMVVLPPGSAQSYVRYTLYAIPVP
ncbi:MAG: SH3 domain-containing protein [Chloroflexi bacterium]|nr:SH3 domain-containing protein [Chloroflexota bacterium]